MTPVSRRPRLATCAVFLLGSLAGALGVQVLAESPSVVEAPSADRVLLVVASEEPTTFRMASLNVLGHAHTAAHGDRPQLASGPRRMRMQLRVLRDELVDVVGFQELEWQQHRAFLELSDGEFAIWPREPRDGRGTNKIVSNAIAWRTAVWELVGTDTVTVPYRKGTPYEMPVVLLRHRVTDQQVYVTNVHNPAGRSAATLRWRAEGRAVQSEAVDTLRSTTGLPVFWTGDFNDREVAYCDVRRRTDLVSATGGRYAPRRNTCTPPEKMTVDWIFGSAGTVFTDVSFDERPAIARSTDHRLVLATATVPAAPVPPSD